MYTNNASEKAIKELLALVFADGYEKTGIIYDGATVYIATYDKPIVANATFILQEGDDVWFAEGEEYEKISKKYHANK